MKESMRTRLIILSSFIILQACGGGDDNYSNIFDFRIVPTSVQCDASPNDTELPGCAEIVVRSAAEAEIVDSQFPGVKFSTFTMIDWSKEMIISVKAPTNFYKPINPNDNEIISYITDLQEYHNRIEVHYRVSASPKSTLNNLTGSIFVIPQTDKYITFHRTIEAALVVI